MSGQGGFDAGALSGVVVVCGHYGVGKTALSLSLSMDAAARGKRVRLIDLDVVNPYFRSSDERAELAHAGVSLVAPVYSGSTCNIDMPALSGAVIPAIEAARADEADGAGALSIIDVGGDDAGAFALGRFSRVISQGPYQMLYVVNRCRALTQTADAAAGVLADIEAACRLRATGVVNNSHLMDDTTADDVSASVPFACEVARTAGVPLAFQAVASGVLSAAPQLEGELAATAPVYRMQPYRQTPWSC